MPPPPPRHTPEADAKITAVLGPTNTGKTHLAVERMMGHASGMIGLPLRLLAREIFDRVVKAKGKTRVALITGEEKITPPNPRYYVCTVEAMPLNKPVSFLGVDEIQLCADPERGHTFTNRLLAARGLHETMFLGAATIAPVIRKLLPEAEVITRPRFSELSYVRPKALSRLPKRSAVIAFTAEGVYAAAEVLRRACGGAAVVMGALSPATRNAQVELYQSGRVDYIVATDAIGMGLNMDIEHVAFAEVAKFDGRMRRNLRADEVAQIAGRAGRHLQSGTFSTLAEAGEGALRPDVIARVENHNFPPLKRLKWRNADLDFSSPKMLVKSLARRSEHALLENAAEAEDLSALKLLAEDNEVSAETPEQVRLLWEVCRIPNFSGVSPGRHAAFVKRIYGFLASGDQRIPHQWMAKRVSALDNTSGAIETLMGKIAAIRTWTYIAHHARWLEESAHWAHVTGSLEDKLSLALHERLAQRFVDEKTSALMKSLKGDQVLANIDSENRVSVEGHDVGELRGFTFHPAGLSGHPEKKLLTKGAEKAVRKAAAARAKRLVDGGGKGLSLSIPEGKGQPQVRFEGAQVALLEKGAEPLKPKAALSGNPLLEEKDAATVLKAIAGWVERTIGGELDRLKSLAAAVEDEKSALSSRARGLGFRLVENFGVMARDDVKGELKSLPLPERKPLHTFAVWFGANFFFIPPLLKPKPSLWRLALWGLWQSVESYPALPEAGVMWTEFPTKGHTGAYKVLGYFPAGDRMVRIDRLETLADAVRPLGLAGKEFTVSPEIMGLVGLSGADFAAAMKAIGYGFRKETSKGEDGEDKAVFHFRWSPRAAKRHKTPGPARAAPKKAARRGEESPFAALKNLKIKRRA